MLENGHLIENNLEICNFVRVLLKYADDATLGKILLKWLNENFRFRHDCIIYTNKTKLLSLLYANSYISKLIYENLHLFYSMYHSYNLCSTNISKIDNKLSKCISEKTKKEDIINSINFEEFIDSENAKIR